MQVRLNEKAMNKTVVNSVGKRPHQITRQIGEHLVAAKLGRMGYFATPFAGNVPLFDILSPKHLKKFKDNWKLIVGSFKEV
jgi:hypothetical protein